MRIFAAVLIFLSVSPVIVVVAAPNGENRTVYGELKTGLRLEHFKHLFPGFRETVKSFYVDLELRSKTDFSFKIQRPDDMEFAERYLKKVPVRIFKASGTDGCDSPVEVVFLSYPETKDGGGREMLYSYGYLACGGGGEIAPELLMEKYMEKYGNYDEKDYDHNQYIYKKVKTGHEVGVKPVSTASGEAGLVITVTNGAVLKKVYDAWRAWMRELEDAVKEKF